MIRSNTWEHSPRDGWFRLYDGDGRVLAKMRHDLERGTYVDGDGKPLSRSYPEACAAARKETKGAKGK